MCTSKFIGFIMSSFCFVVINTNAMQRTYTSQYGRFVADCNLDNVRLIDRGDAEIARVLKYSYVYLVTFSPNEEWIAMASYADDGIKLVIRRTTRDNNPKIMEFGKTIIQSIFFSADSSSLEVQAEGAKIQKISL